MPVRLSTGVTPLITALQYSHPDIALALLDGRTGRSEVSRSELFLRWMKRSNAFRGTTGHPPTLTWLLQRTGNVARKVESGLFTVGSSLILSRSGNICLLNWIRSSNLRLLTSNFCIEMCVMFFSWLVLQVGSWWYHWSLSCQSLVSLEATHSEAICCAHCICLGIPHSACTAPLSWWQDWCPRPCRSSCMACMVKYGVWIVRMTLKDQTHIMLQVFMSCFASPGFIFDI